MNEVLVSNLVEFRDVIALIVWWLYPKIGKISVRGSITFSFGNEDERKDDKNNEDA